MLILKILVKKKSDLSSYKHVDLNDVTTYLKYSYYPSYVKNRNEKSNFRKQCKPFVIQNEVLFYKKNNTRVILDQIEKVQIMKMIHRGSDISDEASALSAHRGRNVIQQLSKKKSRKPLIVLQKTAY